MTGQLLLTDSKDGQILYVHIVQGVQKVVSFEAIYLKSLTVETSTDKDWYRRIYTYLVTVLGNTLSKNCELDSARQ